MAKSSRACAACQKHKRRCDKELPCCSLCVRLRRECDYSDRQVENELRARVRELESQLAHSGAADPTPPPPEQQSQDAGRAALRYQLMFLDSDLSAATYSKEPCPVIPVSDQVTDEIGDASHRASVLSGYFETAHRWFPFISKIRLTLFAERADPSSFADYALLILSMKLIQAVPADTADAMRAPAYDAAKELSFTLDSRGAYSLLKLQSNLLLAAYELVHGILPAAYMSVGYCAAQGVALGLHDSSSPQMLDAPKNWVQWEERMRLWWMVVILDRCVTTGGDDRPLFTGDPNMSSHLPVDDEAWDRGESTVPDRLFVASPAELLASPFARVAQAAHLLGQVIAHCNRDMGDLAAVKRSVGALHRTATALLDLLAPDTASAVRFQSAIGLCLSALMKLSNHHSCDTFATQGQEVLDMATLAHVREITVACRDIMRDTVTRVLSFMGALETSLQRSTPEADGLDISPFALHCVYRAAVAQAWMGSTNPMQGADDYVRGRDACVSLLRRAGSRWKIAGAYLKAFDVFQVDLEWGQY